MRTNRDKRLLTALRLAMGSGLAAAMIAMPAANAAEEDEAAELERVQVTGSRISRLDIEGATPVVTITREDLDNSGFQSVADYLRSNSFNSFGSFRESSGNSWQGQATLSLRGVGANRTLILVNGKRIPGSPVTNGQIQNLNTIPFAAVEKVEILSDGASAIYGSDAIGGVVNIILREDYEGGEITVRGTDPDRHGGAERGVSLVTGFSGDRGRVTMSVEADYRDILWSRDRDYIANQNLNAPNEYDFFGYTGVSESSRTIIDPATGTRRAMIEGNPGDPGCSVYGLGFDLPIMERTGGTTCGYEHTLVSAYTAELDRLSMFMDAEYDINSDLTFYARALHSRVESFGRYAPAAGAFAWTGPNLAAETITHNGQTVTLSALNTGDIIAYRFDITGPGRDSWQEDFQSDIQIGLEGYHAGMQWHMGYQYDLYKMHEWGDGYVNVLGLIAAATDADNPWDPRHPDQAQFSEHVAGMRDNANRRSSMEYQRFDVGAQFDGPMLFDAGPMQFYVGGEYRDEAYRNQTQAQAEAGNILGTAGGSGGGDRYVWAVFGETVLPITDNFEIGAALRFDTYNDFGEEATGKVSFRYQPTDYLVLRGSYGTGFRAPSLDELYQAPSQSFEFVDDVVLCREQNVSVEACLAQPDTQYESFFINNPNLSAETSTQYLLGGVLNFRELTGADLTLSLDYYYIEVEDLITGIGAQDALFLEYAGILDSIAGVEVNREGLVTLTLPPANFSSFDTSGIDFRVNWNTPIGPGDLSLDFQTSYILEYNSLDFLVGPLVDQVGRRSTPQYRADLNLAYTVGRHTVALHSYFIPGQDEFTTLDPNYDANDFNTWRYTGIGSVDDYMHHNISYIFEAPWNARIQVGVNNVTDEDPVLDSSLGFDDYLYPLTSQALVFSYTQRF